MHDEGSLASWQELLAGVATAAPEALDDLIRHHAWDVVWPALDEPARMARVHELSIDDKRLLLTLLFRRMCEYARQPQT